MSNIKGKMSRNFNFWNTEKARDFITHNYENIDPENLVYEPHLTTETETKKAYISGLKCKLHPSHKISKKVASTLLNNLNQPCELCSSEKRRKARKNCVR